MQAGNCLQVLELKDRFISSYWKVCENLFAPSFRSPRSS
jgi:hypothetical protein